MTEPKCRDPWDIEGLTIEKVLAHGPNGEDDQILEYVAILFTDGSYLKLGIDSEPYCHMRAERLLIEELLQFELITEEEARERKNELRKFYKEAEIRKQEERLEKLKKQYEKGT